MGAVVGETINGGTTSDLAPVIDQLFFECVPVLASRRFPLLIVLPMKVWQDLGICYQLLEDRLSRSTIWLSEFHWQRIGH